MSIAGGSLSDPASGQKAMVDSRPVVIASDQSRVPTTLYGTYAGAQIPVAVDSEGKVAVTSTIVSAIPTAQIPAFGSINAGATVYTSYTATQKVAIKQFYAGGTGIGKQEIYLSNPTTTAFVLNGDFESTTQAAAWIFSSNGAGTYSQAYSTAQKFTGAGSISVTFSVSDSNHYQQLLQTFSSAMDFSNWQYISARFYNNANATTFTRTIQIILTDSNSSTRTYTVNISTAAPNNVAGWYQILGDIANPTASTGVSFDVSSIISVGLKFFDSANKTGTVYWDSVQLIGQLTPIFPIYHQANSSFNIAIDPVVVLTVGSQVIISQTNNDTARKEYFAVATGVTLS